MYKNRLRQQINNFLQDGGDLSESVVIEVTCRCNNGHCAICYANATTNGRVMSVEGARCIVEIFKEFGIAPTEVWLTGGEPTMHPELWQIAEVFSGVTEYIAIVTTGYGFSLAGARCNGERELWHSAQKLLDQQAVKEIAITLNSSNGHFHNALTCRFDAPIFNFCDGETLYNSFAGAGVPRETWSQAQICALLENNQSYAVATRALKNLQEIRNRGRDIKIAIQTNVSKVTDLNDVIGSQIGQGVRIDKVMLQVMNRGAGRASLIPDDHPLLEWMTPTFEMAKAYFDDLRFLVSNGIIEEGAMIDSLPDDIVSKLEASYSDFYDAGSDFYCPFPTPAISCSGMFRVDVVG